jgi:hypothetical protein
MVETDENSIWFCWYLLIIWQLLLAIWEFHLPPWGDLHIQLVTSSWPNDKPTISPWHHLFLIILGMVSDSKYDPNTYMSRQKFIMIYWLVVGLPLWKIWKSMGRIIPYIFRPMVTGWHDPVDTTRYLHAEHGISHVLHQDLRDELQTLRGLARALTCFYRIHLKQSSQISYVRKVLGCGLTNLCKPDIPSGKLT